MSRLGNSSGKRAHNYEGGSVMTLPSPYICASFIFRFSSIVNIYYIRGEEQKCTSTNTIAGLIRQRKDLL